MNPPDPKVADKDDNDAAEEETGDGDRCPYCRYFNSPPAADLCEHAAAWTWDGQTEGIGKGRAFSEALKALGESVYLADPSAALVLQKLAKKKPVYRTLINRSFEVLGENLTVLAGAETGAGWSTGGMLGGSGYTLYVPDPVLLVSLEKGCREITEACKLKIQTSTVGDPQLEFKRPLSPPTWKFVASGYWSEDLHHSGHIAYYIAALGQGNWLLDGVERNVILDGLTQEDVDEGLLNDDQVQAMWGTTLEMAQSAEHRQIAAFCSGASDQLSIGDIAHILYQAVCTNGGKDITEPDRRKGLVKL